MLLKYSQFLKSSANINTSICNKFAKVLSIKNFRDYRSEASYFRDYRYKSGNKPSPYQPQFSLTEQEREGKIKRILNFYKNKNNKL